MEFAAKFACIRLATLIILIANLSLIQAFGTPNYCAKGVCRDDAKKHIGCNSERKFSPACAKPTLIPMSTKRKNLILMMHNRLRNFVASGNLSKFEPASNMSLMVWDDELAYLAELNVKQCKMKHDECRSTVKFKDAGQNLAYSWKSGSLNKHNQNIRQSILGWFMEHKDAKMDQIRKYGRSTKTIGHFTAMVRDASSHIGCAISTYDQTRKGFKGKSFLLACNYANTNFINKPIYIEGMPCSQCRRCHHIYTALCDNN